MNDKANSTKQTDTMTMMKDAWNKGRAQGQDMNISRQKQRTTVAKRVKALRTEKGISQEKFADTINANFLTYKGYENCKSDIPLFYLVRIADALDTSLDYLAGRTDTKDADSIEERLKIVEEWIRKTDIQK